jgi:taurine dioxygenase
MNRWERDVADTGWHVEAMDGPFGAIVRGLDLASADFAADRAAAVAARLLGHLYRHKVLVLPAQAIDDAAYVAFGRYFGRPLEFFLASSRGRQHPELIRVTNATTVPVEHRDGAVQWHNDSSYEEVPARITMLHCKEAPDEGGVTLFTDIAAAFAALPEAEQARLRPLVARHTMLGAPWLEEERTDRMQAPEGMGEYRHPLVMVHPETGVPALYPSATARTIEGWDEAEGRALILKLRRHMVGAPFRQSYRMAAGDIMIWDNFAIAHSATPIEYSDEPGKRRILERISTKEAPPIRPIRDDGRDALADHLAAA